MLSISLFVLIGCGPTVQSVFQSPVRPVEAMQPCNEDSFYEEMKTAITGAQGVKEVWLLDYAERAERCNIDKDTLIQWINII